MNLHTDGTLVVDELRLAAGGSLHAARLHYRTLGSATHDVDGTVVNAVLLLHGTTGSGLQFLQPDFAAAMFGPGQPLDLRRWFIVLPDALGHGHSSKPSDGLFGQFPAYGYRDMVAAQHLLCRQLSIDRLRLVLGTSMGGMQTWLWAGLHPNLLDAAVAIACEPAPVAGRNLLWRQLIAQATRADPGWTAGDLGPTSPAYRATWPVSALMNTTPRRLAHIDDPAQARGQLDRWSNNAPDPYDMTYALEASTDYDPRAILEHIRAPLLWINFVDDEINPIELRHTVTQAPTVRAVDITAGANTCGHQTFAHAKAYADHVTAFLADLLPDRHAR